MNASAPPEEPIVPHRDVPVRSAVPNQNVTTGRSKMAAYGATLAANYTIVANENETRWPLTVHTIDATRLMLLFYNIIFQICTSINRELAYADLTVANQLNGLRQLAKSVAFDALEAAYCVLYNKARSFDPNVVRGIPIPSIGITNFPIFIATLINALGPFQSSDIPSRRTHVPIMTKDSVDNQRPAGYQSYLSARFRDKLPKSKYATAAIEYYGTSSNAWWSFWATKVNNTTVTDLSEDNALLSTYRIWSPIKYESLESYFKIALIYANGPLVRPGIGFYSVSDWYFTDDLPHFNTLPRLDDFPAAARAYPFFNVNCSAFHHEVQVRQVTIESPQDTIEAGPSNAPAPRSKKRRVTMRAGSPTYTPVSPSAMTVEEQRESQYRLVYFYFDHIAIDEARPYEYNLWAVEMNVQA